MEHVSQSNLAEKSTESVNKPVGVGGWLVLFQLRMLYYLGVAIYIVIDKQLYAAVLLALFMGSCAMSFYKRNMAFRGMFVGVAVLFSIGYIYAITFVEGIVPVLVLIISTVIDIVLVVALYRSRRVKNTFVKKSKEEQTETEQA